MKDVYIGKAYLVEGEHGNGDRWGHGRKRGLFGCPPFCRRVVREPWHAQLVSGALPKALVPFCFLVPVIISAAIPSVFQLATIEVWTSGQASLIKDTLPERADQLKKYSLLERVRS
jgi:hypothetical protein